MSSPPTAASPEADRMAAEAEASSVRERNKRTIRLLIESVWQNGRVADPAPEKRGLRAVRSYHESFANWFLDFDDIEIDVVQQVAEGDRVVTHTVLRALHKEKNRHISFASIRIDRMSEGKIAEHWSVADMAGLLQQLAS
jgi:predicted ester cyclase